MPPPSPVIDSTRLRFFCSESFFGEKSHDFWAMQFSGFCVVEIITFYSHPDRPPHLLFLSCFQSLAFATQHSSVSAFFSRSWQPTSQVWKNAGKGAPNSLGNVGTFPLSRPFLNPKLSPLFCWEKLHVSATCFCFCQKVRSSLHYLSGAFFIRRFPESVLLQVRGRTWTKGPSTYLSSHSRGSVNTIRFHGFLKDL